MRIFWTYTSILCQLIFFFPLSCGQTDVNRSSTDTFEHSSDASNRTGANVFDKNCKICHGADGRLGLNGAKDLSVSQLPIEERVNIISNGKNLMTPFRAILSRAEIDSVAAFTFQLRQSIIK